MAEASSTTNVRTSLERLAKTKDKDPLGSKEGLSSVSSPSTDASKRNIGTNNTTTNTNNANIEKAAEAGQRIYENSFRMAPERKFPTEMAKKLTNDILSQHLSKASYSAEKTPELSKLIAKDIIQAMKGLNLERYKFIADVTIGEFRGQGIRSSSRALWDQSTDSFTSATFKNVRRPMLDFTNSA